MMTRRPGRRSAGLALSLGALALLSACATRLPQPITGYTCCNLRMHDGWISSNNVQGGTLVPAGEPVKLDSIKRSFYVYGSIGSADVAMRDDSARTEADTRRWLGQIVTGDDPRLQIAGWSTEVRSAVLAGRASIGMTRAQVLTALGPPSPVDTPDQNAASWRYWTALDDQPVDLIFGEDGRLSHFGGMPTAVRRLSYAP